MPAVHSQPKKANVVHIKTRGRIICFCARACQINQHNILQQIILCFNYYCALTTCESGQNLLARRLL